MALKNKSSSNIQKENFTPFCKDENYYILQKNLYNAMCKAIDDNNIIKIREILDKKFDVNFGSENVMLYACKKNTVEAVELFLPKINSYNLNRNYNNKTLLEISLENNNMQIVNLLLPKIDVNFKLYHYTKVLTIACEKNYTEVAKFLIEKGVMVNPEYKCKTPLMYACENGNYEIVKMLINRYAKVNIREKNPLSTYHTPLDYAISSGNFDIVKLLVENGASVNLEGDILLVAKKELSLSRAFNLCGNKSPISPLKHACAKNNVEIIKYLIQNGADVNFNSLGEEPIIFQVIRYGNLDLVKFLIDNGANIDINYNLNSPLLEACFFNEIDIIKFLVDNGADINCVGYEKDLTPFMLICSYGNLDMAKYFVENSVNIHSKDRYLNNCLGYAYRSENKELIDYLIELGVNFTYINYFGHSPEIFGEFLRFKKQLF